MVEKKTFQFDHNFYIHKQAETSSKQLMRVRASQLQMIGSQVNRLKEFGVILHNTPPVSVELSTDAVVLEEKVTVLAEMILQLQTQLIEQSGEVGDNFSLKIYQIGSIDGLPLVLDCWHRCVILGDRNVALTDIESRIFQALVEFDLVIDVYTLSVLGCNVSYFTLEEATSIVRVHIFNLKQKLAKLHNTLPERLINSRGNGYFWKVSEE